MRIIDSIKKRKLLPPELSPIICELIFGTVKKMA